MSRGVVAAEEDGVGRQHGALARVAVQGPEVRDRRRLLQRVVGVQDVRPGGEIGRVVEARGAQQLRVDGNDGCFGETGAGRGDQADAVAERGQALGQVDHHPLGATVAHHWQAGVMTEHDMHGGRI